VPQSAGTEIFEPGDVFRDHVKLENVVSGLFRRAENKFEVRGFTRREIAGKSRPSAIPVHFFFVAPEKMSAESNDSFRVRFAESRPANAATIYRAHAKPHLFIGNHDRWRFAAKEGKLGDVIVRARQRVSFRFAADKNGAIAHHGKNLDLREADVQEQRLQSRSARQEPVKDLLLRVRWILGVEERM
jgi:hypothetical protein